VRPPPRGPPPGRGRPARGGSPRVRDGCGARYSYTVAPSELVRRALRLKTVADRHGTTLRAAALAFCAAHPAVASVLVGARPAHEVRDCAHQFAARVPGTFWQHLRAERLLPAEAPVPGDAPSEAPDQEPS
jgi:D-threo-aldose 1-dehydrogenase